MKMKENSDTINAHAAYKATATTVGRGSSKWPMGAAFLGAVGGGAASGAAAKACVGAAVGMAGFGPAGVVANSFAAGIQGASVASGGLFAACQSIGATGTLAYLGGAGFLVVGGAAVIGATVVGAGVYVGVKQLSKSNAGKTSSQTKRTAKLENNEARILKPLNTTKLSRGDSDKSAETFQNGFVMQEPSHRWKCRL
ncbi:Glycine rich superfamily member [Balamuthia mandrillaris]